MEQRAMLMELLKQGVPMATACGALGVCRATGYKWKSRYEREGPAGLEERSRAPHHRPHALDSRREEQIVAAHSKYGWGAKKLKAVLEEQHPKVSWPAASTIGEVLKRHGRVRARRRERRPPTLTPGPLQEVTAANDTWAVDFKGEFRLGNGRLCYPLTISDQHSRMLLCCHGFTRIGQAETYQRIAQTLEEYGAPKRIRSDNGIPFRLGFSVWLADRGIDHEPTRPGKPSDNGRHERMHRTLKEAVARPPRHTLKAQQQAFDAFQHRYNHERPHEALGLRPPRSHYRRSRRQARRKEPFTYPGHMEQRRVYSNGYFRWNHRTVFLSEALRHRTVALQEVADDVWEVRYRQLLLGYLNDKPTSNRQPVVSTMLPV